MKSQRVGDVFSLSIDRAARILEHASGAQVILGGENYRDTEAEDPELAELAKSIAKNGQLQPVLLWWYEKANEYRIAAGFRRIEAMVKYRARYDFRKLECKLVGGDRPDLIRIAENFDRKNPTSYETCSYMYKLTQGDQGWKRSPQDIADSIGLSVSHVRNLIRFFRELPETVKEAWRKDRDLRFSFSVLNELLSLKDATVEELGAALDRLLKPRQAPASPLTAPTNGVAGPHAHEPDDADEGGESAEPQARKLGRVTAAKLAALFEPHADRVITDDRAVLVYDLLRVFAGDLPAARAKEIAEQLLRDLGVNAGAALKKKPAKTAEAA